MGRMQPDGTCDPDLAPVREALADVLAADAEAGCTGSALAVFRGDRLVVDLWGGWADAAQTRRWERDTLVMPYSVTKPFAAVAVLALVDRGVLELDVDLATYWPELTARTTLRQVLSHTAGLVELTEPAPTEALFDHDRLAALLAAQPPSWEPGTAVGELALFYGTLLGEVVRRVDGRSLGTVLREEVCGPLGLDFHVGLRADEQQRTAELTGFDADFLAGYDAGTPMGRALANPPGVLDPAVVNDPRWRAAEVGAVNGHGTARAVAGLYVALEQGRLLSPEMRAALTTSTATGPDRVVGSEADWGLGVGLDPDGYGMGGTGGSFGWCSTAGGYVIAFVSARVAGHDRGDRVEQALRECLHLPAL